MNIHHSAEELIGGTPLLELRHFEEAYDLKAKVIAKLEFLNLTGSAKDRIARKMIDDAEEKGILKPGSAIIEPTSGNTGIGLASVGTTRGYRVIIVMPANFSEERIRLIKAYGAEVVLSDASKGMAGAIEKASELAGPEIFADTEGTVDLYIATVGTGGTLTGTGRYLKEKKPSVKVIAVEPDSSAVLSGDKPGPHAIQGIGAGFIPKVLDTEIYDEVIRVTNEDALRTGAELGKREGISVGDVIHVEGPAEDADLTVTGIFDAGGDEDEEIFAPLDLVQKVSNTDGYISSIEVSALTTPDNELAEKAAKDPGSLTIAQYELWYCTAYVSSICYQIQEAITDSVASPVRQVAESEGAIMDKTELLMILITILSLIGSALGITNLVTASVMERSNEIGLFKAVGAKDSSISGLVLTEILLTGVAGAVAGYFLGFGFAQIIGHTVFNSSIEMKPFVIPVVAVLMLAVTLIGSIPAIRMLLRLDPAEVLHGR